MLWNLSKRLVQLSSADSRQPFSQSPLPGGGVPPFEILFVFSLLWHRQALVTKRDAPFFSSLTWEALESPRSQHVGRSLFRSLSVPFSPGQRSMIGGNSLSRGFSSLLLITCVLFSLPFSPAASHVANRPFEGTISSGKMKFRSFYSLLMRD